MDSYYDFLQRNPDWDAEEPEEKVCVCPDHLGKTPVFCEACNDWTDNVKLVPAVPYNERTAAENVALLAAFNKLMDETFFAMAKRRTK